MSETIVITETLTETLEITSPGVPGPAGVGVPAGGTTGQALVKASNADFDTEWGAGGGGASALVDLTDVTGGPPVAGEAPVWDGDSFELTDVLTAAEAAAGYQPLDSDLTALAALTTTAFGRGLLELANQAALLSAAGAAAAAHTHAQADVTDLVTDLAGKQPLDADLTAIAALAPTNDDIVQRKAGAWTNRTMAQLIADLAALGTTFQPLDSDLTAIAALTTTAYGRSLLEAANAAALRTLAGLVIGTDVPGQAAFDDHSARHENGGLDEISLAGLSGTSEALQAHLDDAADAHDASAISVLDTAGDYTATDVEGVLAEIAPQLGGGGSATTVSVTQAGHGLVVGDVVRLSGTSYVVAQADTVANAEVVGIVSAVADTDNFTLTSEGRVTGLSGLTAGTVYFLSAAAAGAITGTEPAGISKPVMVADTTTSGFFSFSYRGIGGGGSPALTWQSLSLINAAAAYGVPYGDPSYLKDSTNGLMYLAGAINPGTDGECAQLPVGDRPATNKIIYCFADGSPTPVEIRSSDGIIDAYMNPTASVILDGAVVRFDT